VSTSQRRRTHPYPLSKGALGRLALLFGLATAVSCGRAATAPETRAAEAAAPADFAHTLLGTTDFADGVMLPWMPSFTDPAHGSAEVKDGALCLHIDAPGQNRWDAQIRHRSMTIEQGHSYRLAFTVWATRDTKVAGKVGMSGPPYTDYWTQAISVTTKPTRHAFAFSMTRPDDAIAELAFHAGGHMLQGSGPLDLCFDDVVLSDPRHTAVPRAEAVPPPAIRVNQIGYLPRSPKRAVWVSASPTPARWTLTAADGNVLTEGTSQVHGADPASGDSVHVIDFSTWTNEGTGLRLLVGDQASDPFPIAVGIYRPVAIDALRFLYHNRSGIAIEMPYAGDPRWARPAGHLPDRAVCAPGTECDYTLDVTGGWYDAGDHGKYGPNTSGDPARSSQTAR
jgi:endoglucanase